MKKVTLIALDKSIEHWERMHQNKPRKDEIPNSVNCALCDRFNIDYVEPCQTIRGEKCPVYLKTGKHFCKSTPYSKAFETFGTPKFTKEAAKMILFLKSLRPTDV